MKSNKELRTKFDFNIIPHLGIQMYSTIPPILVELISNSYDADASKVIIEFSFKEKKITLIDDGHGMSFDDANECYLNIGRNRRKEKKSFKSPGGREVTGRKGLGNLSVFGLCATKKIYTKVKNESRILFFEMSYDKLLKPSTFELTIPHKYLENGSIKKNFSQGTRIVLEDISKRTRFDIEDYARNIANRFISVDNNFQIELKNLDDLNESSIYLDNNSYKSYNKNVQFTWRIPNDIEIEVDKKYAENNYITGEIIAFEKPINQESRGVYLYARGKLAQEPSFMDLKLSDSFGFDYINGKLNIDFIENFDEDCISTDRRNILWESNNELLELKKWISRQINNIVLD